MRLSKIQRARALILAVSCVAFVFIMTISTGSVFAANTANAIMQPPGGSTSLDSMADQYIKQYPEAAWLRQSDIRDANNNPIAGYVNPAMVPGAGPLGTFYPPTSAAAMGWKTESRLYEGMYLSGLKQLGGFNGQVNSDLKSYAQELQAGDFLARTIQYPPNVANQARAQILAQAQTMTNAMGDIAKSQSASAITYCSGFMQNFTAEEGNKWNKIRNGLFIPIAILLLLPGAILTQVKAMAAYGNPVLGSYINEVSPLEGILQSVVAIFLIPATYLVVNYGIDFSNSIINSIASTYQSLMGTNMYADALGTEVRAFPVRTPGENQNAGSPQIWPTTPVKSIQDFENNYISNKIEDPSAGLYNVPKNKTDEAMPAGAVADRELSFGANAALTAGWNVLCAFQMAYLCYLFFVGPIVAALWVWPLPQFRSALPNWIEGVITLCFWSLFWNTAILLMACFKGVDDSGTIITSALNFLATASVKFAFDFAGLVSAAGQEAAQTATQNSSGGKAGSQGKKGDQGKAVVNATGDQGGVGAIGTPGTSQSGVDGAPSGSFSTQIGTPVRSQLEVARTLPYTTLPAQRPAYASSLDLAPPPMARTNSIYQQSTQLGNFTISTGLTEKGQPVDLLKGATGHVIAELPQNITDGTSVIQKGVTVAVKNNGNGQRYNLTDGDRRTYIVDPPSVQSQEQSPNPSGVSATMDDAGMNTITLKSSFGQILLSTDGKSLLMPRTEGDGYDSFSFDQNSSVTFALPDRRVLSLSHNANGVQQLTIRNNENRNVESFAIKPNGDHGFNIQHGINGVIADSSTVLANGDGTVYTNYDKYWAY